MDDPNLDLQAHLHARKGLARLNRFSGAAESIWRPIADLVSESGMRYLRVLDIATGTADVPLKLWQIAKKNSVSLQIDGCDFSESALEDARQQVKASEVGFSFFRLDVLHEALPLNYDVVMTSLFTHHLSAQETVSLMRSMGEAAKHMVIIADLERSRTNACLVWLATRLLTTSRVVHFDGPASVGNAYTRAELLDLAKQAGLEGVTVRRRFPCRMVMTWRKQS